MSPSEIYVWVVFGFIAVGIVGSWRQLFHPAADGPCYDGAWWYTDKSKTGWTDCLMEYGVDEKEVFPPVETCLRNPFRKFSTAFPENYPPQLQNVRMNHWRVTHGGVN